ncbi:tRNA (adenosine(37)-N6)-threonylcarbamoyltransferase complex transferase subunit TsaD [Geotalea uraniireducens]|uniref:tRNA N6-adenosine threonylcarbamoyltransferase n=1 Tax=Geotalea uraniireducens (strain Rf4) TaxID=351605 RepID=TSAD_GEOUR|nr:tRNA (adenosine(37)-N6)-threonylcarbamoyltransferase complex transferase subunit TsaD [Geotalea uraniireducens]A5G3X1.1 RecName: Full=tRNA N6-adenosine threonylcarbamoyltransferase; AltName: Full=N6-L-threonylcarbamoyladenine synthase; Short=t(6)A synthase; AltName: Full=t(6)A37 threonylcarbamoyladenosine biosynthesis protein TsaD; AltName: Full=tRNA threonylcarbamoyladenosine biosynthesis protein TsaD [Geotalea uraniireducens Rf4]ABQ26489.1 O-sialoglycoprotein endopeptidase [Geotalea uraniire
MLLLAIESSCDETAAAVVRDGRIILSNIVASQISVHAGYGGVVPEIASRKHLETISTVIEEALQAAGVSLTDVDGIAVTQGPGLAGALLVGISTAKAMAYALGVPIAGVNHIESHILAIFLERSIEFPFVALAVSGGHTHLYLVEAVGRYKTLGQTLDDAAGEAFDKVAKLLGLPYPGGALIDRLAAEGDPEAIRFPRPLMRDESFNFSFSGLKTSVLNYLQKNPAAADGRALNDLCASFQAAVCDVLVSKTAAAVSATGIKRVVVAGGVACNNGLRREMSRLAELKGIELHIPSPLLCSDNAAMIAVPGDYYLSNNILSGFDIDALPVWPLDSIASRLTKGS